MYIRGGELQDKLRFYFGFVTWGLGWLAVLSGMRMMSWDFENRGEHTRMEDLKCLVFSTYSSFGQANGQWATCDDFYFSQSFIYRQFLPRGRRRRGTKKSNSICSTWEWHVLQMCSKFHSRALLLSCTQLTRWLLPCQFWSIYGTVNNFIRRHNIPGGFQASDFNTNFEDLLPSFVAVQSVVGGCNS